MPFLVGLRGEGSPHDGAPHESMPSGVLREYELPRRRAGQAHNATSEYTNRNPNPNRNLTLVTLVTLVPPSLTRRVRLAVAHGVNA